MYSVVLMAAITAGSASPDFCCFFGGGHSYSCGGCYGGCYGGCCGGWSCYGCHGCYGGCWGCYGGGYTSVGYGGGFGGCYGGCQGCVGCYGGGCYGCVGYYGASSYGVVTHGANPMPPADKKMETLPNPGKTNEVARAKVVIDVPANTALYIDNQLMPDKSGKRTFVTPALQPGQSYFYDIKLVANNGGQQQVQTSRVVLRPGQEVAATFNTNTNTGVAVTDSNR